MCSRQHYSDIDAAFSAGHDIHTEIVDTNSLDKFFHYDPPHGIVTKLGLEYLADARHWNSVDDKDLLRPRRPFSYQRLGEGLQFFGRRLRARPQGDITHRQFARIPVRLPDGSRHCHRRMRLQRAFDQHRIDIVTAADDQVLRSAGDEDPPRLVGISKIAAVEIAITNRVRVMARIAITRRDVWSGNRQHADLMR